jgi:hypothetical protein
MAAFLFHFGEGTLILIKARRSEAFSVGLQLTTNKEKQNGRHRTRPVAHMPVLR